MDGAESAKRLSIQDGSRNILSGGYERYKRYARYANFGAEKFNIIQLVGKSMPGETDQEMADKTHEGFLKLEWGKNRDEVNCNGVNWV